MNKEAFGVTREDLLRSGFWPEDGTSMKGIRSFSELYKLVKFAKSQGEFRGREAAEKDFSFQQLIMYAIILDKKGNFLLYERSKGPGYTEGRLAGMVSIGVGGHMDKHDKSLPRSLYRELAEELTVYEDGKPVELTDKVGIKKFADISVIGVIKEDLDPVGQVHFGVLCFVKPKRNDVEIHIRTDNGENVRSQYVDDYQYLALVESGKVTPETWTRIAFDALTGIGVEG